MRLLSTFKTSFKKRFDLRTAIRKSTQVCNDHLTPEIKLHLITPSCPLWVLTPKESSFIEPYWAFYWAGGQALAKFILENSAFLKGKNVIDIGSGCGACAIAAANSKALRVVANDIDPVACEVISMNSQLNNTKLHINNSNLIGSLLPDDTEILLIGDMFYDSNFGNTLFDWLLECKSSGIQVFIGDPGRYALDGIKKEKLLLLQEYPLLEHTISENNGFPSSFVWKL